MKKLIFILFALLAISTTAQTVPNYKTVKLTGLSTGGSTDDILTIGADKTIKKVAKSSITTDISGKENTTNKSTDGTLMSNSDIKFPTEKAVKTYVDSKIGQNSNEQFLYNTNHYVLANQTEYQKIFSGSGELTVEAGKTYIFIMEVSLYQFSTYGRAVSFSMLGTANIATPIAGLNVNYTTVLNSNTPDITDNVVIFPDNVYFTDGHMGWSGTAHIKGSFRASVNGTMIPAFKFDALPGDQLRATAGSYFILKKLD